MEHILGAGLDTGSTVKRLEPVADLGRQVQVDVVRRRLLPIPAPLDHLLQVDSIDPVVDDIAVITHRHVIEDWHEYGVFQSLEISYPGLEVREPSTVIQDVAEDPPCSDLFARWLVEYCDIALGYPIGSKATHQGKWPNLLREQHHVYGGPLGRNMRVRDTPKVVELPSSVNAGRACGYALLTVLLCACATHVRGLVEPTPSGARLTTLDGRVYKLVLTGSARPIHQLDGHLVDAWGPRVFNAVRVARWRVGDGLHGMPTWVGVLVAMGQQLGIEDVNTGVFYLLDDDAAETLRGHVGEVVLVEGYVVGPHQVRVLYYRLLEE